jgi:hypothetical protein
MSGLLDVTGVSSILDIGGKLIDRLWPDPAQKDQAKLALFQMQQAGEFKEIDAQLAAMQMQADTNKAEAASGNAFVAGWRPFVGWTCGAGCAWNWVGQPVIKLVAAALGHPIDVPPADITEMLPLLAGMLGMGSLHAWENIKVTTTSKGTK